MLSAGNLGPKNGWDVRLRSLPGDARLRLDRDAWQVTLRRTPVSYQPIEASDAAHERRLRTALEESFASTRFDHRRWLLPLSGGYDSRGVLMLLPSRLGLRTVTWGLRSALARRAPSGAASVVTHKFLGMRLCCRLDWGRSHAFLAPRGFGRGCAEHPLAAPRGGAAFIPRGSAERPHEASAPQPARRSSSLVFTFPTPRTHGGAHS
jgi:hypothetical protein